MGTKNFVRLGVVLSFVAAIILAGGGPDHLLSYAIGLVVAAALVDINVGGPKPQGGG